MPTGIGLGPSVSMVSRGTLVDPTKWIGAYNWDDNLGANLVTSLSGSSILSGTANSKINSPNNLAPLAAGGYGGSAYCVDNTGNSTSSFSRASDFGSTYTPTSLSFGYFGKRLVAGSAGPDFHTSINFTSLVGLFSPFVNAMYNNALTTFTFPQQVEIADTNWHHYAFTWAASENIWRAYVDGVLTSQVSVSGAFAFRYIGSNNSINGARSGYRDNMFVIADKIDPLAIAALATGRLPNAAGVLL